MGEYYYNKIIPSGQSSLAVTIPMAFVKELNLSRGNNVKVSLVEGKIIIEKIEKT